MNEQEFIQQLKKLQTVQPSAEWKARNRTELLSAIEGKRASAAEDVSQVLPIRRVSSSLHSLLTFILPTKNTALLLRPAGVFFVLSIFVITSGVVTVGAAQDTIPGDSLYSVKITTENIRKALTLDEQEKAILEIEFAEKRIEELEQIVTETESEPLATEQVETVLDSFEESITSAQNTLNDIVDADDQEVIELAGIIEEKTTEFKDTIEEVAETASPESQPALEEAADIADDTSTASLTILIEEQISGETELSLSELSEKVDNKLLDLETEIDVIDIQLEALTSATSTAVLETSEFADEVVATTTDALTTAQDQNDAAEEILEEAKELLTENNLGEALIKISEGKELVDTAEEHVQDIMEETIVEGIITDDADAAVDNTTSTGDISIKDSEEVNESEDSKTIPESTEPE